MRLHVAHGITLQTSESWWISLLVAPIHSLVGITPSVQCSNSQKYELIERERVSQCWICELPWPGNPHCVYQLLLSFPQGVKISLTHSLWGHCIIWKADSTVFEGQVGESITPEWQCWDRSWPAENTIPRAKCLHITSYYGHTSLHHSTVCLAHATWWRLCCSLIQYFT